MKEEGEGEGEGEVKEITEAAGIATLRVFHFQSAGRGASGREEVNPKP
jgi:hypothetical protein